MRLIFDAPSILPSARKNLETEKPPRCQLLIVDDDPLLIKSLRDTLEADGHIVIAANGGLAGIDAFRAAQEKGKPFLHKLYEGIVGGLTEALENRHDDVAAKVDISGRFDNPDVSTWQAVVSVIRNAFVRAITPGLEPATKSESG